MRSGKFEIRESKPSIDHVENGEWRMEDGGHTPTTRSATPSALKSHWTTLSSVQFSSLERDPLVSST
ncbi:hypothetical protein ACLKA6_017866 [Drosophila palustris]